MADEYELVVVELGSLVAAEGAIAAAALDFFYVNAFEIAIYEVYV